VTVSACALQRDVAADAYLVETGANDDLNRDGRCPRWTVSRATPA